MLDLTNNDELEKIFFELKKSGYFILYQHHEGRNDIIEIKIDRVDDKGIHGKRLDKKKKDGTPKNIDAHYRWGRILAVKKDGSLVRPEILKLETLSFANPVAKISLKGIEFLREEIANGSRLTLKEKEELKIIRKTNFSVSFTYRGRNDNARITKLEKTYDGDFYITGFSNKWNQEKRYHGQEMGEAAVNGFNINAVQFFQGIIDNTEEINAILNYSVENLVKEALK